MAKIKREQLVAAAKDLNEVLGLEPPINTNTTKEKELVTALSEVVDLIDETDEIKDSTREVLVQLGFIQPDVEDVEDDEFEEQEEGIEDITPTPPTLEELMDLIADCNSTKELKELMKSESELFDGFTPSAKVKNVIDLRTAMLDFLEKEEVEELKEEEVVKVASKKSQPKKGVKEKPSEGKIPIKDGNKKLGVIATIANCIKSSKDGITKDEIFEILKTTFPERNTTSMRNTINIQVPNRLSKEKFKVSSKTQPDGTKLYFYVK